MRSLHLCLTILLLLTFNSLSFKLYDSCNNFDNENACRGNQTENDASWANRSFQTPPRNDSMWREGYQDYNILVGYASTSYYTGRRSANIKILTRINPKYSGAQLTYYFNEKSQQNNDYKVDSSFSGMLNVRVEANLNGEKVADLKLDSLDFIWNHP